MAAVVVQVIEVGRLIVLQFVVAALDSPDVGPMRRGGMIRAEKVKRARDPFVQIFLQEPARNHSRFDHAAQAIVAGSHVERFLAQHVRGRASERRKRGILQHLKLEFPVAVYEVGVGEEVQPVIDFDVESAEQALVFEGAALQHLLGFHLAGRPEEVDEQGAHLPTVAHLFDHDAGDGAAIVFRGRGFKQIALLLHAGKFGVALIDDHVHERVPHLLRGHLAQVLPLVAAFVGAELDFFRLNRAVESIEVECLNVVFVDANFLAPLVEQPDPVAEVSDSCYFAWHKTSKSLPQGSISCSHLAVNTAGRFSTYAASPSFASSLWNRICWFSRSTANADSMGISHPVCTARLMRPTAFAALLGGVNWRAYSMMFSIKPSRSKMSFTMPYSCASSNENVLPVIISSMALLFPTRRDRRCVPPVPGSTPRLTSGRPILPASLRAMRRSAAMAISSPPPTQWPLIAAITSLGVCSSRSSISFACRQKYYLKVGSTEASILMFAPAEKNLSPTPVSTITCTSLSMRALRMASSSWRFIS